jgi:hypothetical protein
VKFLALVAVWATSFPHPLSEFSGFFGLNTRIGISLKSGAGFYSSFYDKVVTFVSLGLPGIEPRSMVI